MLLGFGELIPPLAHLLVAYHGLRSVIFGDEWPETYRPDAARLQENVLFNAQHAGDSTGKHIGERYADSCLHDRKSGMF